MMGSEFNKCVSSPCTHLGEDERFGWQRFDMLQYSFYHLFKKKLKDTYVRVLGDCYIKI